MKSLLKYSDGVSIKVGTYNVAKGKWGTPDLIAASLAHYKFDVLFLNEVPVALPGSDLPGWHADLGQRLGLVHSYIGNSASPVNTRKRDLSGKYCGGNHDAVLSRTPLVKQQEVQLYTDKRCGPLIRVETTVREKLVALYAAHLRPDKVWEGSGLAKICEALEGEFLPTVIVGGDFNRRHNSDVLERFGSISGLTSLVEQSASTVDHVFAKSSESKVTVSGSGIDWGATTGQGKHNRLSDHPCVWAELRF